MKLTLHASPNNWERFQGRKQNELFKKVRAKLIKQKDFTCEYCQFKTPYLDIVNIDQDYNNNVMTNFATACVLCVKCRFMDAYKLDYAGTDKIIYCPELDQAQIIHLCRVLFCKIAQGGDAAYNAKMILAQLQDRATFLDTKANCQLSNPAMFATYLMSREKNLGVLPLLKWLPSEEEYSNFIPHWQEQFEAVLAREAL